MTLVDVYDGAFIHPMSNVPTSVKAIIGYASGPGAYHIWPYADVMTVRHSGRQWWAIDVPVQSGMNAQTGIDSARRLIAALPYLAQPKSFPCFMDVEYDTYEANPSAANAAIQAFSLTMNRAGYARAFGYAPYGYQAGWVSDYTYQRPTSLPGNAIGWQYENDKNAHPGWDASVFDSSLFDPIDVEWNLADMKNAVIIRRLSNGDIYRLNLLDGTCCRFHSTDAVRACENDLKAAGIPFTSDSVNDISAYVEVNAS